jgi:hypothetical protein
VTARALLWQLLKHVVFYRRGGDPVYLMAGGDTAVDWLADDFSWAGDDDAFCVISAVAE